METLVLQLKNIYGTNRMYPICQSSRAFAHLTGTKTLSFDDLKDISFLGFRIGFNNIPSSETDKFNDNGFDGFADFIENW